MPTKEQIFKAFYEESVKLGNKPKHPVMHKRYENDELGFRYYFYNSLSRIVNQIRSKDPEKWDSEKVISKAKANFSKKQTEEILNLYLDRFEDTRSARLLINAGIDEEVLENVKDRLIYHSED